MPDSINQLIPRMWPEPRTAKQEAHIDDMDALEFEVFTHKLATICLEGKEVLAKTGASMPLQSEDSNTGLYTAQGDMASSAPGVYYHSLTGQLPVKWLMDRWGDNPSVGIKDGDIFYSTDPLYGATHTPDQIAFLPVFAEGQLVAWVSSVAHQSDVGAVGPGMAVHATNRYQDGLRLSPIKIGENDALRDDLIYALAMVTRAPDEQILDIKARVASATRMRNRLSQVASEIGVDKFVGGLRRSIDEVAERSARKLERYKDGTYRHTLFLDSTGVDISLLKITCEIRKRGSRITLALGGCSPQVPYAYNAYAHMAIGAFANPLFSYLFSDLPASVGVLQTVEVEPIPEGTIISADESVAVNCGLWPTFYLQNCFHVCLMKMAFASEDQDKISAAQNAVAAGGFAVGVNRFGRPFADLFVDPNNGTGSGARPESDGVDDFCGIWGNWMDTNDTEQAEARGPYIKLYSKLGSGSGYGRHRGGTTADVAYMAHEPPGMLVLQQMGYSAKLPSAPGLFGGYAGNVYPGIYIKKSDVKQKLASGELPPFTSTADLIDAVQTGAVAGQLRLDYPAYMEPVVEDGDIWCYVGAQSGGYGDPLEREPAAVAGDLRGGIINADIADRIYGVKFDELTGEVDPHATAASRAAIREQRLKKALSYDQFVSAWSGRRPPAQALSYYGEWPNP